MTEPDIADPDDRNGGLTSTNASITPSEDGFAAQITAEFTSRRHTRGEADRWISTRLGVRDGDICGLDRTSDGVGRE